MDPQHSAQDVVRCTLCKDAVGSMYCEFCHIHICDKCDGKHLSDKSKAHRVVSLTQFVSTLKYPKSQVIQTEEQGYTVPPAGAESSLPDRTVLEIPCLITDIATKGYRHLCNVSCLSDKEIWISGQDKTLKLFNLKGELIKSIETKSGNVPEDIAVAQSGKLVYTDYADGSINLVSDTHTQVGKKLLTEIQILIKLRGWRPRGLCSTSTGDLLVIMEKKEQTKVVRFSGSTVKQSIQWDDQGQPLYTSGNVKYLSENRNLDIYVADSRANAVVAVSAAGTLRFRYTGPPSTTRGLFPSDHTKVRFRYIEPPFTRGLFYPDHITTDSLGNILTSDGINSIHIIDQDGSFLRCFNNCSLWYPRGLSVDSRDNLFVAEYYTGHVKKIQCYK